MAFRTAHLRSLLLLALGMLVTASCSSSADDASGGAPGPGGTNNPGTNGGTGSDGGGIDTGTVTSGCSGEGFLASLGKDRVLVGAMMEDATADGAGRDVDLEYLYIAGGVFDSNDVCSSCTADCTSGGTTCEGAGCAWWGCWQDTSRPPGDYLRRFANAAAGRGHIPFITYYQQFLSSNRAEGEQQLEALNDTNILRRYLADWRFLLQQVGNGQALLHIEPDLWGYLQFFGATQDPRTVPAQVTSANPTDCGSHENNAAGFARCMVAMARKYAPNAKVGLHASPWATRTDVFLNMNASYDVEGDARKVADFLLALGAADTDFVTVEASDRDAGFYESTGENVWWDPNNATLPHFQQAFRWVRAVSERMNKPNIWWQLPVGNMNLPNADRQWRDNRVDYFFSHTADLAAAHSAGFLFGAGEGRQTTPETDSGNLLAKVRAYKEAGGQPPCVE